MVRVAISLLYATLFPLLSAQTQAPLPPPTEMRIPTQGHGLADVLQLTLDEHLYFAAELALQHASDLAPEQAQYFKGMLAFHEGRFEDARSQLIAALNVSPTVLTSSQKIAAFETLADNARITNLYGCAWPKFHPTENRKVLTVRSRPDPPTRARMESYETKGRRYFGEAQVPWLHYLGRHQQFWESYSQA